MPGTRPKSPASTSIVLAAIVVLAVAVRLYNLTGRSLWLDEILTSQPAHLSGPGAVVEWSQAALNQMPLFYLFTWLLHPWGDGELVLRLPAVVAGALTVPAVFLIGKATFGTRAGVVAALLTAVVPFAVWYSQEARNYSLLMLLTTMQMYFALISVKRSRARDWIGLAAFTTLNLYTHYLALLATAAMGVFVGIFLIADLLRNAPQRVKVALAGVVAISGLAALLVPWRALLKNALLHRGTAIGIGFISLCVVTYLAIVLWPRIPAPFRPPPQAITKVGFAVAAAAVVALSYAPWLPTLRVFLSRPDQSLGQIHTTHPPNFGDLMVTLAGFGLSGLLLATFLIGLVTIAFWTKAKPMESGLVSVWIGVPLLLFLYSARSAIVDVDVRYLAFMFPAAMVVIAGGVEGLADAIAHRVVFLRRQRGWKVHISAVAASAVLTVLLLAQAVTALAASYQQPKDDWRGVANHIASASPPGSVVLALGDYSDWTPICLDYYFRQIHHPLTVIEGAQINSEIVATLSSGQGAVWAVVIFPAPAQLTLLSNGSAVKPVYTDGAGNLRVVRAADSGAPAIEQARALLRWELPQAPQLAASIKLLDHATPDRVQLGPNIALTPKSLSVTPGATLNAGTLVLTPDSTHRQADATFVFGIEGETDYLIEFERICTVEGQQRIYAITFDQANQPLATFPSGAGYSCPRSGTWTRSYFAFQSPPKSLTLDLVVRANAPGQAQIRELQLRSMSESI